MELEGKIIKVLEERGGVSARTGTPWKVKSYVLEVQDSNSQFPRRMVFDVFGEERINNMNIQEGQDLRVSFDIDAREYQGRWFNSIRAWKVEPAGAAAPVAATPGVTLGVAAAPSQDPFNSSAPQVTPPFGNPDGGEGEGSTDDLPF